MRKLQESNRFQTTAFRNISQLCIPARNVENVTPSHFILKLIHISHVRVEAREFSA